MSAAQDNLLNVVLDRLQKSGKTNIFTRIIYVARFARREYDMATVREFHRKAIEKHAAEVSGLLLVYPAVMVHVLEATTPALMDILAAVQSALPADSKIAEARVISSTEDIPSRCFHAWHAAFMNSSSGADTADACDGSTIVKTASELSSFLRKAGAVLEGQPETEVRRRLESLESYMDMDVPAPEVLLSLTPAADAPTLAEYLDMFNGPVNVDFDSDMVWPMPAPLQY
ncbi:hypothetical protein FOA52_008734 [Chlamydomonas sp. UWO 241]|nr:hypothetical protein FOA52_008734 [Chlamydomonas sp. UWO 241]